ncbi:MAG: WG repeat-containing protein [Pseudomonadota bacterium]
MIGVTFAPVSAFADWQIILGKPEKPPICTAILTPSETSTGASDLRLRLLSDTGKDLRFSTVRSNEAAFELVLGDLRAPLAAFSLRDIAKLRDAPMWQALLGADRFHMTQSADVALPASARFDGIEVGALLADMGARCGLLTASPDGQEAEDALALGSDARRLVNATVFRVLDEVRAKQLVSDVFSDASRDRMARALQRLGAPPARFLDEDSLETLLGHVGVSIAPAFEAVTDFSQGVAGASQDRRWGMINRQGAWIIAPRFDAAAPPSNGYLSLRSSGIWRLFDGSGARVSRIRSDEAVHCDGGVCRTVRKGAVTYRSAVDGRKISGPWDRGTVFDRGIALVEREGLWRRLFADGTLGVETHAAAEMRAPVAGLLVAKATATSGWRFLNHETLRPYGDVFDDIAVSGRTVAAGLINQRWGLVSVREGAFIQEPRFSSIGQFGRGLAPATLDGQFWGYVRRDGAWAIAPTFLQADRFAQGYAGVKTRSGDFGLIDSRGDVVLDPLFEALRPMVSGQAAIRFGQKWGFVSKDLLE